MHFHIVILVGSLQLFSFFVHSTSFENFSVNFGYFTLCIRSAMTFKEQSSVYTSNTHPPT